MLDSLDTKVEALFADRASESRGELALPSAYQVEKAGNYVRVKQAGFRNSGRSGGGPRGIITQFSPESRKRALETANKIDWEKDEVRFITLTYKSRIITKDKAKRDLDVFFKRVARKYSVDHENRDRGAWAFWRLEFQKRGTIHYHILLGNGGFWKQKDLQETWQEITGEEMSIVHITKIDSQDKAIGYVLKYVAKTNKKFVTDLACIEDEKMLQVRWPLEEESSSAEECSTYLDSVAYFTAGEICALDNSVSGNSCAYIDPSWFNAGRVWGIFGRKNVPWLEQERFFVLGTEAVGKALYAFGKSMNQKYQWGDGMRIWGDLGRDLGSVLQNIKKKQKQLPDNFVLISSRIKHDSTKKKLLIRFWDDPLGREDSWGEIKKVPKWMYNYGLEERQRLALLQKAKKIYSSSP